MEVALGAARNVVLMGDDSELTLLVEQARVSVTRRRRRRATRCSRVGLSLLEEQTMADTKETHAGLSLKSTEEEVGDTL